MMDGKVMKLSRVLFCFFFYVQREMIVDKCQWELRVRQREREILWCMMFEKKNLKEKNLSLDGGIVFDGKR